MDAESQITEFRDLVAALEAEIGQAIVGQSEVVRRVLVSFFAGGHVLLEGAPGLGKTLLVKSVSRALGLAFKRIQFTPDLMPADIVGAQLISEGEGARHFEFRRGPIFANIVLADEINRATPKTQSALLEAMEERQVTSFGETHALDEPFFVLATQNPIELEGTYPLPEAQLDRFLFKVLVGPPSAEELTDILRRTTTGHRSVVNPVLPAGREAEVIARMRALVREVAIAPPLERSIAEFIVRSTPGQPGAPESVSRYVRFGPGPRAAQSVALAAKVRALLDGRGHVAFEDIVDAIPPAARHRLIPSFQAEAEGVSADDVLREVIASLPRH